MLLAQETAEKCLELVAQGMVLESDQKKLTSRVWRWMSVCERYFGIAIVKIIQPEGQDIFLQNELWMAAMRHFTISCKYADRASKDQELIVSASINW